MSPTPRAVTIPLVNPNEPEALIASLSVVEGQRVSQGDLLCTLETTKASAEVHAESAGYVIGLRFSAGQTTQAGEIMCYLAEQPDAELPKALANALPAVLTAREKSTLPPPGSGLPEGLRITQPALNLAREAGLELEELPRGPLVTEAMVRERIAAAPPAQNLPAGFDEKSLIIYGGGGHGKMLIDLVRAHGVYRLPGLVDDGLAPGKTILGVPVLGGGQILKDLYQNGARLAANAVGGIGNLRIRVEVFERLAEAGFDFPMLVHPTAFVEPGAQLAAGAQVFAHAYVGSEAQIGLGVIVNTGVIVSHDCQIGNYVNISPGALLAGEVSIGERVLVGMGVTVNLGVRIGPGARIGNGATVKSDVPAGGIVRAGMVWPPD
jgi:sugar O-acyltransferase (sialic acid O-acetyltransferase NeuD family)